MDGPVVSIGDGPLIAITGGTVVTPAGAELTEVLIQGETIVRLGGGVADADEVVDAAGLVVMPGAIDPHVHLGDQGQSHRETFAAGTAAALLGGITSVFEHPLSVPPTTTGERYRVKRSLAERESRLDVGLWGAIALGSAEEIRLQWANGARGFKAFVVDSASSFPHVDDASLLDGMREVAALGGLVLVHCENDSIVAAEAARAAATGARDGRSYAEARPAIAEIEATARVLVLAREAGVRIQIVHVSDPTAAAHVDDAVARGLPAALEHTMHHLVLDLEDAAGLGPWARCAPPLRSRASVEALWARLVADGPVQLGCDHSPYSIAEKEIGSEDVFAAGMGIQSLQESVPFFLDEALHRRGLTLERCAEVIAGQAASTLGLRTKGVIAPGADADLAIWDLDSRWVVDPAVQHQSVNRWSPLAGRSCDVRLVRSFVRGRVAALDGEVLAEPGDGRFLVPESVEVAGGAGR